MYVLGYLPRDGRIYLADKDVAIISYALSLSVVEYQTLVLRGDMEQASELLETIPADQKNKIARFLEGQGYKELALEIATDPEHKFDLALSLGELKTALEIAREANVEHKWKTVGDAALTAWDMALAEECFTNAKDLGSLLLLHSSTGNGKGLRALAEQADVAGSNNIAFTCLWQLSDVDGCIALLLRTNRVAEAVLFAQTYKPSAVPGVVAKWKESLVKDGKGKLSKSIAAPPGSEDADEDLFPEWDDWIKLEKDGPKESLIDVSEDAQEVNGDAVAIEPEAEVEAEA
jgi:coatomer subunit beta'